MILLTKPSRERASKMDILNLIGAFVMSGFIALTVVAMYLFIKGSISLDPHSEMNHAIGSRFDSPEELRSYHDQHRCSNEGLADHCLRGYSAQFARVRARLDPKQAEKYPDPVARYDDLK